jgi:hypothetical protein
MFKHVDDDGDLSLFIMNGGEVGIVCDKGHSWTLKADAKGSHRLSASKNSKVLKEAVRRYHLDSETNAHDVP